MALVFGVFLALFFFLPFSASAVTLNVSTFENNLGLSGLWSFDGKDTLQGTIKDRSGNGYDGNAVNYATSTFFAPGKIGQGLNFDGVDDEVSTGKALSTFISNTTGTVSVWVKPTGSSPVVANGYDGKAIVQDDNNGTAGGTGGYMSITQGTISGENRIWVANYGADADRIGVPYTNNQWIHIVWVHSGGVLYAYGNGVLINSLSSGNTGSLTNLLYIGGGYGSKFQGSIDDVRIYSRALTANEIKALYNSGAGTKQSVTRTDAVPNGLVGYWTMDGKDTLTGTIKDRSGNGNDGNATGYATSTFFAPGKIGQGLNFDGVNDYVDLGSPSSLTSLNNAFTYSAWFKAKNIGSTCLDDSCSLVASYTGSNSGANLTTYVSTLRFYLCDATNQLGAGVTLKNGVWYHAVGTYDGTNITLYLDGVQKDTKTHASCTFGKTYIGRNGIAATTIFNGLIDDVRIYSRALSASEIKDLYNSGAGTKQSVTRTDEITSGLVGYWTFDGKDTLTGTIKDRSGNGNDGNATGYATTTFFAPGKIGQGLKFDGVNDYVNIGDKSAYTFSASQSFSFSYWEKGPFLNRIVLGKKAGSLASASGWMVEMASDSTQNLYLSDGTNQVSTARTLTGYTDGNWHFITYVINRSNNTETVYMDAVARGATIDISTVTGIAGTGASMLIGTKGNLGQYYSGTLDDVRIYSRALSAAEIQKLYNMGR